MQIVVFDTPEAQATGLLAYRPIPKDTLFLFPRISSVRLTTVGLTETIRVVFLDARRMPVMIVTPGEMLISPGKNMPIPVGVRHVVEASLSTPILAQLGEIRAALDSI